MDSRTRALSEQGRDLLSQGFLMTSESLSPRSQRVRRPSRNAFEVLQDSEDEFDDYTEEQAESGVLAMSPKDNSRFLSSPNSSGLTSPRWQVVASRRVPKLDISSDLQAALFSPPIYNAAIGDDKNEGDMSSLSFMTTDTKSRRSTSRTLYGNKANQLKAKQQREYSKAKRNEQRASSKRSEQSGYGNEEEIGAWDYDD
jgi:hypothetical protein